MTSRHAVVRTTLAEQVQEQLVLYISENELKPGDSLPSESQLVERYGVSRPVVREALRALQGQQVIRIASGKGAVIKNAGASMLTPYFRQVISADVNPEELLQARAPIEIAAARLAAANRTDEDVLDLRALLEIMKTSLDDPEAYAAADAQFHVRLAEAGGNTILAHFIESMHEALRVVSIKGLMLRANTTELRVVTELHDAILEAVSEQDVAATRAAMKSHFDEAFRYLADHGSLDPDLP